MTLQELQKILPEIRKAELTGRLSHSKIMDLSVRKDIYKTVNHTEPVKSSAVLALLYPDAHQQIQLVFILRKTYNGHHSGQIAFPGGKKEPEDITLWHTALRETQEEVGINPKIVQFQKKLSRVFIPVSNYCVQAFLGMTNQPLSFQKDPVEVEDIIQVSFSEILSAPKIPMEQTYFGKNYTLHAFDVNGLHIWGATAMILSEIVDLFHNL